MTKGMGGIVSKQAAMILSMVRHDMPLLTFEEIDALTMEKCGIHASREALRLLVAESPSIVERRGDKYWYPHPLVKIDRETSLGRRLYLITNRLKRKHIAERAKAHISRLTEEIDRFCSAGSYDAALANLRRLRLMILKHKESNRASSSFNNAPSKRTVFRVKVKGRQCEKQNAANVHTRVYEVSIEGDKRDTHNLPCSFKNKMWTHTFEGKGLVRYKDGKPVSVKNIEVEKSYL